MSRPASMEIVTTSDGDVGTVIMRTATDVEVMHFDRPLGRGPWYFTAAQVIAADDATADSYVKRCDRLDQEVATEVRDEYRNQYLTAQRAQR